MEPTKTERKPRVDPEHWLEEYGDWLYQFAMARVHDSHTAEDLVQETLVAGFRSFGRFEQRSTVRTWLTAILRRRIADHFQQHGRRQMVTGSLSSEDETDHFAFAVEHSRLFHPKISNKEFRTSIEREEFMDSVQHCVGKLPLHLRQAFVARTTDDDKSLEQISDDLSITRNNLAVRLFRSRLLMRECLERMWTNPGRPRS